VKSKDNDEKLSEQSKDPNSSNRSIPNLILNQFLGKENEAEIKRSEFEYKEVLPKKVQILSEEYKKLSYQQKLEYQVETRVKMQIQEVKERDKKKEEDKKKFEVLAAEKKFSSPS
jgi:hypothetical protein